MDLDTGAHVRGLTFAKRLAHEARAFARHLSRRLSSSLTRRIALINLIGLVAMLLGQLWINQTRVGVIEARIQSLSTQAEIIAAAVAASVTLDTNVLIVDPDKLLQLQAGESQEVTEPRWSALEFSLNPETVAPVLRRLVTPTRTRARVFDREGTLLLDTKAFYSPGDLARGTDPLASQEAPTLFERSWSYLRNRFGKASVSVIEDPGSARSYQEVTKALQGLKSSVVRVTTAGDTVVYAAAPVQRARMVRGVLLLSTEEGDVDRVIEEERVSILMVFAIAALVMLVLSVILAGQIAEPVRRLSEAADRVRRGANSRQQIPDFSDRSDEIGQLSASLRAMTDALFSRIQAIEQFAADVAHELKNPLTSLRSAVETLPLARNDQSRARLMEIIKHDVRRLDRLISDISDASRLDAELARNATEPLDLAALLETVVRMTNDVPNEHGVKVELTTNARTNRRTAFLIQGHDSRLVQVFDNLIDNARSFSAPGGTVRVSCIRSRNRVIVMVDDNGPGIPERALERVFERFYTDRPEAGFGQNSGLGLSISKQIVEAHGGLIRAENRRDGQGHVLGARLIVSLPVTDA